jgi:hypothetical protein
MQEQYEVKLMYNRLNGNSQTQANLKTRVKNREIKEISVLKKEVLTFSFK